MITQPDYVQKEINENIGPEHREKVHYVYPLPAGLKQKSFDSIVFTTKEGLVKFDFCFDFIPEFPTDADIMRALPQCCSTCANQGLHDCPYFHKNLKAAVCTDWEGYPDPNWGTVLYYANLHKAAYEEKFKAAEGAE